MSLRRARATKAARPPMAIASAEIGITRRDVVKSPRPRGTAPASVEPVGRPASSGAAALPLLMLYIVSRYNVPKEPSRIIGSVVRLDSRVWGRTRVPRSDVFSLEEYQALAAFRHALREFLRFSEAAAEAVGLTPRQYQ